MTIAGTLLVSFVLAQDPGPGKIEDWVDRLGAEEIETRDRAQSELLKIGAPASASLRKALNDSDLERAFRARAILARIEGKKNQGGGMPARAGRADEGEWFLDPGSGKAFRMRHFKMFGWWSWPFWEPAPPPIIGLLPRVDAAARSWP